MAALKLTILVILLLASTTYGLNYDDVVQYFEREMFRIAQPTKLGAFYPNTFDLRVYYPQCNFTVYEEGLCAAHWAIAVADTISDLICISTKVPTPLSAQHILDCVSPAYNSCTNITGTVKFNQTLSYLVNNGITTAECYPYTSIFTGNVGSTCSKTCRNATPIKTLYKIKNYSQFTPSNINGTKTFLINSGPVVLQFDLYDDLLRYNGGVYNFNATGNAIFIGSHYAKIIGWDTEKATGKQFWIVAPSYGDNWGLNGYFNIYTDSKVIKQIYGFSI